jgi:hypothetical protein
LAASLIFRLRSEGCSAAQAVHLFHEVLDEVGKPPARSSSVMHQPNPASSGKASCFDVDQLSGKAAAVRNIRLSND